MFTVIVNKPGHLPEAEPTTATTLPEVIDAVHEQITVSEDALGEEPEARAYFTGARSAADALTDRGGVIQLPDGYVIDVQHLATAKIKLSAFQCSDLSGSELSYPGKVSGYDPQLEEEVRTHINAVRGCTLNLTAESLRQLAEFGEAMVCGWRDSDNPAGANSWQRKIDECRKLARELETQNA